MDFYSIPAYQLKILNIYEIEDAVYFNLKHDYWYNVVFVKNDKSVVIDIGGGLTFEFVKEEMIFTEIRKTSHSYGIDTTLYQAIDPYEQWMEYKSDIEDIQSHIKFENKTNTQPIYYTRNGRVTDMSEIEVEKWVRTVEREVNRRYIDAEIDRLLLEPVLNVQELSKLAGIKYRKST